MKQVAKGVWRLSERPAPLINVYLVGDVLIDAGRKTDRRRILRQIRGREISLLALTHAHPDHQGTAKRSVKDAASRSPATSMTSTPWRAGSQPQPDADLASRLIVRFWQGPPHRVDRPLREGDEVAGFRVVHAPGHSPGEVIFFRDDDHVVICGDVIRNLSYLTMRSVIKEPPDAFTYDPGENRRSIHKLAELGPSVILPGHGAALTDIAKFERFVTNLPGTEQPRRERTVASAT